MKIKKIAILILVIIVGYITITTIYGAIGKNYCDNQKTQREKDITFTAKMKNVSDKKIQYLEKQNIALYITCLNNHGNKAWIEE